MTEDSQLCRTETAQGSELPVYKVNVFSRQLLSKNCRFQAVYTFKAKKTGIKFWVCYFKILTETF